MIKDDEASLIKVGICLGAYTVLHALAARCQLVRVLKLNLRKVAGEALMSSNPIERKGSRHQQNSIWDAASIAAQIPCNLGGETICQLPSPPFS